MTYITRLLISSLLTVALTVTRLASAAPPDDLIDQGVELRRQARGLPPEVQKQKHAQALELFQRAHAQAPSPRTLAQMGLAEQSLQRWLDAEAHLASALSTANASFPWIVEHRGPLEQALGAVRRHIGQLVIRGTPSGANVYVNSQPQGTLPLPVPIRLPEGDAAVQITAPGHQPHNAAVRIPAEGSAALDVQLEPVASAAGQGGPTRSKTPGDTGEAAVGEGWGTRRILGASLIAAGVAAAATGITFVAVHGKPACNGLPAGVECANIRNTRTLGLSLIAAGAAAGAGGGFLVYQDTRTSVSLAVTPTALIATGRF